MENNWASPLSTTPIAEREDSKVGKKREIPNNALDDERTKQESGEHECEDGKQRYYSETVPSVLRR
jgi:hypothetical protein